MSILCFGTSSTLLCGEDRNSVLGLGGCDGGQELVEVGSGLDHSDAAGAVFPVDTDEAVRALVEKETDHLPQEGYAERLEHGGLESSWRKDAMDWICKVREWKQKKSLGFIGSSSSFYYGLIHFRKFVALCHYLFDFV